MPVMSIASMRALVCALPLVAACYAPDLRDCTVACESAADCADGQVCGADHMCASADMAGHCGGADAATAEKVALRITIMGHGRVEIDSLATCDTEAATHGDCTVMVPRNVVRTLTAIESDDDKPFIGWTTQNCAGQDATCKLTPTAMTTVGAKFK